MNSYELSRNWFDWCFENPEKVSPNHSAIFFFAIEHCNRLGWKTKFGFPTQMAMDAIGIKKHQTYIKYFNDLCEWGFFILVQKSANQYSSNIISLSVAMPKNGKALGKAIINHTAKQTRSNGQSNSRINKPNKPINSSVDLIDFEKLLKFINETFERKGINEFKTINEATRKSYIARLKEGYTATDIKNCILVCKTNEFHVGNQFQYCTPEYFSRSKTIDKFKPTQTQSENKGKSPAQIWYDNLPTMAKHMYKALVDQGKTIEELYQKDGK